MSIYDITERIGLRPDIYLGGKYIILLKSFLDGYRACELDSGSYRKESFRLFPLDFGNIRDFISLKTNAYSSESWDRLLMRLYGSQEAAFDKFFEIFAQFRDLRMSRGWRAELVQDNIDHNNSMRYGYIQVSAAERKPVYTDPVSVCIVELSQSSGYMLLIETETEVLCDGGFLPSANHAVQRVHNLFGIVKGWYPIEDDKNNIEFEKPVHV
ncbi:MAG: hypothetical protein IJ666_06740 [Ruminococcus sp.]|nr:hypothetical protein [Ruminococcus sp.]